MIQQKKFYSTLPHKLDAAEEDYWQNAVDKDPDPAWIANEEGTFGEDGWSISVSHKSVKTDD